MVSVLIIGSGGREHAFTWKASQSDLVDKIFVAPGNAGTSLESKAVNIEISPNDIESLDILKDASVTGLSLSSRY